MERLNEHELLKDTCNKTIDIKISTHAAFLEQSSSVRSKSKDWKTK